MPHIFLTSIFRLLAAGGGAAVVAYAIFRWLGKSWLDQHLNKKLEQFKHEQQKELEQIRHDMNAQLSRVSKIHEKEIEILPRAWQLLQEANGAVFNVITALKRFPDFSRMSEPQFEEFLNSCRLADFKKSELREATDRQRYYHEAVFWVELDDAKRAQTALNNYLAINSIFMMESLRQQFADINRALATVLISEEVSHQHGYTAELRKSIASDVDRISELFDHIQPAVQKRLGYDETK
jgi:hypothetical protein